PGWLLHGLKWSAFVIPIAWSIVYPLYGGISGLELKQALVASVPDCARAQSRLGDDLANLGETREAQAHYEKAVELKPNSAEIHNSLGSMLARQQRYEDAAVHYQQALRLKPDYRLASDNLHKVETLLHSGGAPAVQ